jgi:ABC-type transport system involved in cytochrome bd biosynthesis fused ATPase/permease subunit
MKAESSDAQSGPPEQRSRVYFPRRLRFTDDKNQVQQTDDDRVRDKPGAKIILGEPGMGKSTFLEREKEKHRGELITATDFMFADDPRCFVESGQPLLIDGFDEAVARNE